MVHATAIGWRAHAALEESAGVAKVIAPLSRSFYAEAAGELIWVGASDALLHPRAVLATDLIVPAAGARVHLAVDEIVPWRPTRPRRGRAAVLEDAHALRTGLLTLGPPRGLARLLIHDDPHHDAVITRAAPHVRALAVACARHDARAAIDAARPLLGLADRLTPSGDDYVGAVLSD